ncbi:hypothetical protein Tco_1360574 [Tanacetum coccineum]
MCASSRPITRRHKCVPLQGAHLQDSTPVVAGQVLPRSRRDITDIVEQYGIIYVYFVIFNIPISLYDCCFPARTMFFGFQNKS